MKQKLILEFGSVPKSKKIIGKLHQVGRIHAIADGPTTQEHQDLWKGQEKEEGKEKTLDEATEELKEVYLLLRSEPGPLPERPKFMN